MELTMFVLLDEWRVTIDSRMADLLLAVWFIIAVLRTGM